MIGEATQSKRLVLASSQSQSSALLFGVPSDTSPVAASPGPATPSPKSLSLVLIDEADIVFEDDKGFESAVLSLIESAKCPVVITANSTNINIASHLIQPLVFVKPPINDVLLRLEVRHGRGCTCTGTCTVFP